MNKLSGFIAGLFVFLVLAGSSSILAQAQERPPDFAEFEGLASGPIPWIKDGTLVPDYRAMLVAQVGRFSAFLEKYPDSPLKAEAILRMALLHLDVEKQEIHMFRRELFFCQAAALMERNQEKEDLCRRRFMMNVASVGGAPDPVYQALGRQILVGLVAHYPHARRYIMKPDVGFLFDDEEVGGIAMYILAQGVVPAMQREFLEIILAEYKIRPALRQEIENRLGVQ